MELRQLFDTLDVDHDGKVTGQEWGKKVKQNQTLLAKYFGGNTLKEIGSAFKRIDTDGNASLSWEEFVAAAGLTVQAVDTAVEPVMEPDVQFRAEPVVQHGESYPQHRLHIASAVVDLHLDVLSDQTSDPVMDAPSPRKPSIVSNASEVLSSQGYFETALVPFRVLKVAIIVKL